jgi:hypothetical protein
MGLVRDFKMKTLNSGSGHGSGLFDLFGKGDALALSNN